MTRFKADLPHVYPWESQAPQYPLRGEPGISYFAGDVSDTFPGQPPVDCLLYRDFAGRLLGILNHYPDDYPPWEKRGNVNVWVHPDHQRRGIGTALLTEAMARWTIDLDAQRYTEAGAAFAEHLAGSVDA